MGVIGVLLMRRPLSDVAIDDDECRTIAGVRNVWKPALTSLRSLASVTCVTFHP